MGRGNTSRVITTRILTDNEMDSLIGSIGSMLMVDGFTPMVHTRRLLTYQMVTEKKRGVYIGLFAPIKWLAPGIAVPLRKPSTKVARVMVDVTDLPIGFSVEEGSHMDIPIALAFGISAPHPIFLNIESLLAPFTESLERAKAHAGEFLSGKTFDKRVPGIECDHCGQIQVVTVPIQITRVEGNRGYGPGVSTTVFCSNPNCGKPFEVNWDSVRVEVDFTWKQ